MRFFTPVIFMIKVNQCILDHGSKHLSVFDQTFKDIHGDFKKFHLSGFNSLNDL